MLIIPFLYLEPQELHDSPVVVFIGINVHKHNLVPELLGQLPRHGSVLFVICAGLGEEEQDVGLGDAGEDLLSGVVVPLYDQRKRVTVDEFQQFFLTVENGKLMIFESFLSTRTYLMAPAYTARPSSNFLNKTTSSDSTWEKTNH